MRKMQRKGGLHAHFGKHVAIGVAAAGFLLSPVHVRASEIQKTGQSAMTAENGVFNIFADGVTSNGVNAYNVFDKFNLSSGNIANLYFGTSAGNANALNLLNLVNDRIDINGTVNAIKGSGIGGNLWFVSADGIAVGASGVINAGAINLVTPTASGMSAMLKEGSSNTIADDFDPADLLNGTYAINPTATISVAGRLNAVDGITMVAGTVEVVKESGAAQGAKLLTRDNLDFSSLVNLDGVDSGISPTDENNQLVLSATGTGDIVLSALATSEASATGDLGDEALAALGFEQRDAKVSVGTGTEIDSRGGVMIAATAINKDDTVSDIDLTGLNAFIPAGSFPLGEIVFLTANADVDGKITANNIDVSATTFNQYASTNDADKVESIKKDAMSVSQQKKFADHYTWIEKATQRFDVTPIYSYRDSEAKVNIGKNARLTAKQAPNTSDGNDGVLPSGISAKASATTINVTMATTKIDDSHTTPDKQEKKKGGGVDVAPTDRIAGASIAYLGAYNDAAVNIEDGAELTAEGAVNASASASDTMIGVGVAVSVMPAGGATAALADAAVTIETADNFATVNIGKDAKLTSNQDAVTVDAAVSNSIDLTAAVAASSAATAATAVGVLDYDSAATVTVDGELSGKKGVTVSATNTTSRNNVSANNAVVGLNPPPQTGEQEQQNTRITQADVSEFLDELFPSDSVEMAADGSGVVRLFGDANKTVKVGSVPANALKNLHKYMTAGVSVAVANENNTADIRVGNKAKLVSSDGGVTVKAGTQMDDTHMTATGTLMNVNPDNQSAAEIDASVLVANIDNDAKITIGKDADGNGGTSQDDGNHAVLEGKTVSVAAASYQDWGRVHGILADYQRIIDAIKAVATAAKQLKDDITDDDQRSLDKILADCETFSQDVRQAATLSTGLDLNDYVGDAATNMPTSLAELVERAFSIAAGIQQIKTSVNNKFKYELDAINTSLNNNLTAFLKPENYGNFVASASANAVGSGAVGENADRNHERHAETKLSVAGGVNVNSLDNRATVDVGDYTELNATEGALSVTANAQQHSVAMNGRVNIDVDFKPLLNYVEQHAGKDRGWSKNGFLDAFKNVLKVSDNTSGPNAIGGNVGVAARDTQGTVKIGEHAKLTGCASTTTTITTDDEGNETTTTTKNEDAILLKGENETIVTDITFGSGEAGSVGVQGQVGVLSGDAKSGVTVGKHSSMTAKSLDEDDNSIAAADKAKANINIGGGMDVVATNIVGAISRSNGTAMGASVAVTTYDVDNTVKISGALDATAVHLNALTDGTIDTITVAGTASTTTSSGTGTSEATEPSEALNSNPRIRQAEVDGDFLLDGSDDDSDYDPSFEPDVSNASDDLFDNLEDAIAHTANHEQGSNLADALQENVAQNGQTKVAKLNLAAAGSVSVNDVTTNTAAQLENATVTLHQRENGAEKDGDDAKLMVKAEDASFIGAWSGATAITWQQSEKTKTRGNGNLQASPRTANLQANHHPGHHRGYQPGIDASTGTWIDSYDTSSEDFDFIPAAAVSNHETTSSSEDNLDFSTDGDSTTDSLFPADGSDEAEARAEHRANNQAQLEQRLNGAPSVALAGAAAVNLTDQTVLSAIDNTTVKNAALVQNFADKDGADVAAALALTVSKEQGDGFLLDGAASVSYNRAENGVRARMNQSVVEYGENTKLSNVAYDSDTQVTGGVNLDVMRGGGTTVGVGGTVTLADIENKLAAEITGGGKYENIGSLMNHAALDVTQVGAAVATTISTGAQSNYSFQAAAAVNLLDNDVTAEISGTDSSKITVEAQRVDVAAYDTNNSNLEKTFDEYISSVGVDATGETYLDLAKENAATDAGDDGEGQTYNIDATSGGTTIVGVGVTLSDSTSSKGVGLAGAASASTIDNDFTARVKNANIVATGATDDEGNAYGLDVRANADGLLVNVAAGETASGGSFNGAGSVSVQLTTNDVLAEVANSTVEADEVKVVADAESKEINVAGQIGIGKNGGGLALALNNLDNSTTAQMTETDVKAVETKIAQLHGEDLKEALKGSNISVEAANTGKVYAVGAGVGIGKTAALVGSLALNFGEDDVSALIEGKETNAYTKANALNNIRALNVSSTNDGYKLAVAGGVSGAGSSPGRGSTNRSSTSSHSLSVPSRRPRTVRSGRRRAGRCRT